MLVKEYFRYTANDAPHVVFPLGGIGAGSIGLGADGRLKEWEIFNRPSKGSVNGFSHFAIKAESNGRVLDTRIMHGHFGGNRSGDFQGRHYNTFGFGPRREEMAGFPSFQHVALSGPYPIATLEMSDPQFPGNVELRAFSPYLPLEDRLSSLPVALFETTVENTTSEDITYTLSGCIAFDFKHAQVRLGNGSRTTLVGKSDCDSAATDYAELALSTDHPDVSFQRHLYRGTWFDTMEVYWADISRPGKLKDRFHEMGPGSGTSTQAAGIEHSLLAAHVKVAPGKRHTLRFAIGWYVPNMTKYWVSNFSTSEPQACCEPVWKNYYATQWPDVDTVLQETFDKWELLDSGTRRFREVLARSTLPIEVLDAISANLSIVKTTTALRLQDGTFYGWEGCHPGAGCCEGSCTHVWNYQQVLPFLFPALERSMREADYLESQDETSGRMYFRLALPKGVGVGDHRACADGQFGNVLKTYRDWKLSGDSLWLRGIWPNVVASIEYAWHPENHDNWDPGKTGVLHGRQHHTLDMELYGPNSWLTGFYLGALQAGAEMADAMDDSTRASQWREIFERGKRWMHSNLFNGSYFVQQVNLSDRDQLNDYALVKGKTSVVPGDVFERYWSDEHGQLKYQIADGCEIDQVIAEWHARLYGLGPVFDDDSFASAVLAIYEHNFIPALGDMPNPCRVFGMGSESGTVMCAWPDGATRPAIPVPYSQETMHGFEYAFGCQLMMIGELSKGFDVFRAVRDRYRGYNRNPWNEIECGSNYARSMSSYAALLVLSGFAFDAVHGEMSFAPKVQRDGVFRSLWSNGTGWGEVSVGKGAVQLEIVAGRLSLGSLGICGRVFDATELARATGGMVADGRIELRAGQSVELIDTEFDVSRCISIDQAG